MRQQGRTSDYALKIGTRSSEADSGDSKLLTQDPQQASMGGLLTVLDSAGEQDDSIVARWTGEWHGRERRGSRNVPVSETTQKQNERLPPQTGKLGRERALSGIRCSETRQPTLRVSPHTMCYNIQLEQLAENRPLLEDILAS